MKLCYVCEILVKVDRYNSGECEFYNMKPTFKVPLTKEMKKEIKNIPSHYTSTQIAIEQLKLLIDCLQNVIAEVYYEKNATGTLYKLLSEV